MVNHAWFNITLKTSELRVQGSESPLNHNERNGSQRYEDRKIWDGVARNYYCNESLDSRV